MFTPPVGYSGSSSTVNEICNKTKDTVQKKSRCTSYKSRRTLKSGVHLFASLRKTIFRHCSISEEFDEQTSVTGLPFLAAAQSTSSEVLSDFQMWCFPGCQMHLDEVTMKTCSQSLSASPRTVSSKLRDRNERSVPFYPSQVSPCLSCFLNFCSLTLFRRHCLIGWVSRQLLFWVPEDHMSPRAYLSTC